MKEKEREIQAFPESLSAGELAQEIGTRLERMGVFDQIASLNALIGNPRPLEGDEREPWQSPQVNVNPEQRGTISAKLKTLAIGLTAIGGSVVAASGVGGDLLAQSVAEISSSQPLLELASKIETIVEGNPEGIFAIAIAYCASLHSLFSGVGKDYKNIKSDFREKYRNTMLKLESKLLALGNRLRKE